MMTNSNILLSNPAPVRYTRNRAQAKIDVTFEQIERAARRCAADYGLTSMHAALGAALHASYFRRLLQQDTNVFENACVIFLPDELAHHAPALAHATGTGTWMNWSNSQTVCTAHWSRQCPTQRGRALQLWVELNPTGITFLRQNEEGPGLMHTLFITKNEVWVVGHWLHIDDVARFNIAAWEARSITAYMLEQHIQGGIHHDDSPWAKSINPMQLHRTKERPKPNVDVINCYLHHLYSM